ARVFVGGGAGVDEAGTWVSVGGGVSEGTGVALATKATSKVAVAWAGAVVGVGGGDPRPPRRSTPPPIISNNTTTARLAMMGRFAPLEGGPEAGGGSRVWIWGARARSAWEVGSR